MDASPPGSPPLPAPPDAWRPRPLRLPLDLILRLAGYRKPAEAEAEVRQVGAWAAGRAIGLARVEARLGLLAVRSVGRAGVTVGSPDARPAPAVGGLAGPGPGPPGPGLPGPATPLTGTALARVLAGCPLAVAFVLTLGPDVEAEAARLAEERQLLEGYLLDTAGWACLEVAVRRLRRDLASRWGASGLRPTHRLGPGHGDWPLAEQARLLALLGVAPGAGAGGGPVRLSDHGVLVPFKSISGLFGLAPR
jgi:hypothetical protein